MSQRLQVVLADAELRRFRKLAAAAGLSLSEWARQALRRAGAAATANEPGRKLAAVRAAAAHQFPAGEIDEMIAEIDRGRAL